MDAEAPNGWERACAGLYAIDAVLPVGVAAAPPGLPALVRHVADACADLGDDVDLPADLLDWIRTEGPRSGVGKLVDHLLDETRQPFLSRAAASLDEASRERLLDIATLAIGEWHPGPPAPGPPAKFWSPLAPGPCGVALPITVTVRIAAAKAERTQDRPSDARPKLFSAPPGWAWCSDTYLAAADRAVASADALLTRIGLRPPEPAYPFLEAASVLPPARLGHCCSAAGIALTYLAIVLELPTPYELGVLGLGQIEQGEWSVPEESLASAVRGSITGLSILEHIDAGWVLRLANGTERASDDTSLAGAAGLLWQDNYAATVARRRATLITELGWSMPPPGTQDNSVLPLVKSPVTNTVVEHLRLVSSDQKHGVLIVGGGANSGKTVAIQQVTTQLNGSGWKVLTLTRTRSELPDTDALTRAIQASLADRGIASGLKTLVVLEALNDLTHGNIGEALVDACIDTETSIIAVARFNRDYDSSWASGNVSVVTSVIREPEMLLIAERLVDEHPEAYGRERNDLEFLAKGCHGDLWLLTQMLHATAAPEARARSANVDALRRDLLQRALSELPPGSQRLARLLAALTLLGVRLPTGHPGAARLISASHLGVRLEYDGITLSAPELARLILVTEGPLTHSAVCEQLQLELMPYLATLFGDRADELVARLINGIRSYDRVVLGGIIDDQAIRVVLGPWVAQARPALALSVLRALDLVADPELIVALIEEMLLHLQSMQDVTAGEVAGVARLVVQYRDVMEPLAVDGFAGYLTAESAARLVALIVRTSSLEERLGLARQVIRLNMEALSQALLDHAADLVKGVWPGDARHMNLVRRLDQVLGLCQRDVGASEGNRPLAGIDAVEDLMAYEPPPGASFPVITALMGLRFYLLTGGQKFKMGFGAGRAELGAALSGNELDWNKSIDRYLLRLGRVIPRCGAAEMAQALAELAQAHRPIATRLLNEMLVKLNFAETTAALLTRATPAEAAALISTISRLHGNAVRPILYHKDKREITPRTDLAIKLANRIKRTGDARGAGLLLSSVHRADEWFYPAGGRFATLLATHITLEGANRLVEHDQRPSVTFHFFRGLWEAQAPYWREVEEQVIDAVTASLKGPGAASRPWAVSLALLLAQDDHLGEDFLDVLRRTIGSELLLSHLKRARRGETVANLHRLARAIHPDLPAKFARTWDATVFVASLAKVRPHDRVETMRVVAETLLLGGEQSPATSLVSAVAEQSAWEWAGPLRQLRGASELASALDNIAALDRGTAVMVLGELDSDGGRWLARMVRRNINSPATVTDLLTSCQRINADCSSRMLDGLGRPHGMLWHDFTSEITYEQNVGTLSHIGRKLARVGVLPGGTDLFWMENALFRSKLMNTVRLLTAPMAVGQVLHLLYIWRPAWARTFARELDGERMLRRITELRPIDLRALPRLLHLLGLSDRSDLLSDIMKLLRNTDQDVLARRLGIRQSSRLLHQLLALSPEDATAFADSLGRLIQGAFTRQVVLDHRAYWRELGWAAATLHKAGLGGMVPEGDPVIEPLPTISAEVSWAAAWLPNSSVLSTVLPAALARFDTQAPTLDQADRAAMALTAAVRADSVGVLLSDAWSHGALSEVAEARLGVLSILMEESRANPEVAAMLRRLHSAIGARLEQPVLRADPYLPSARELLRAFPEL